MKVAVCIPSYNEKENIQNITRIIDEGLSKLDVEYSVIVNCDNNSPDGTNNLFNMTATKHKKISIVDSRKGKGVNLLNFFKYCQQNDIDYAFTFDSDLKSINATWIEKYYESLKKGNDFVLPLYKRNYQEGNTTNHFIGLVLYEKYGVFIRQPIGGDYGFNKKYINTILKNKFTSNILMYGIDIFMVVTAIYNDMNIDEVELGHKVHKPSLSKMELIFESVLRGFSDVCRQYPLRSDKRSLKYICYSYDKKELITNTLIMKKYSNLCKLYNFNSYQEILDEWLKLLHEYLENVDCPSDNLIKKMKEVFVCRAVSFWLQNQNNEKWEEQLLDEFYRRRI